MVQSSDHFSSFEPHTLLKHAIYRAYIERWARILASRYSRLRIVDACAGTGADESGRPGSPVIAVVEADKASGQMTKLRGEEVRIQVLAIEKDPARFAELAKRMSSYEGRHLAHQGTLADRIAQLAPDFPKVPTLFFIDPFGLEPLQADVVRQALTGPRNEVFLLFADQAALRHLGAADAAAETKAGDDEPLDLFGGTQPALKPSPSRALEITAHRATEIMDAAFGGLDWRKASRSPRPRQAFVDLYSDLLRSFGAARVLALPVYDRTNAPKYHLIYATKSGRGYEVMKDAIERGWKAGFVGSRAVEMMRLGTQISDARLTQLVLERFAGQEVPWRSDDNDVVTVRRFALQETPAMPEQVKKALRPALTPFRVPGRKEYRYRFPPRSGS